MIPMLWWVLSPLWYFDSTSTELRHSAYGTMRTLHIYMALFLIVNNELRHFGICNDDLLFPSSNQIFFHALDCYLQKKICSLFEDKLVLSWTLIFFPNIPLNFSFHMSGLFISIVFSLLMSHDYILFKIGFAFVYIWSASLTSLTWNLSVLTSNLSIIALVFISL
jgi:hypothetical protein